MRRVIQSVLGAPESWRKKWKILSTDTRNESVRLWLVCFIARDATFFRLARANVVRSAPPFAMQISIKFNSVSTRKMYSIWFPNERKHKWQLCLHAKLATEFELIPVAVVMQPHIHIFQCVWNPDEHVELTHERCVCVCFSRFVPGKCDCTLESVRLRNSMARRNWKLFLKENNLPILPCPHAESEWLCCMLRTVNNFNGIGRCV